MSWPAVKRSFSQEQFRQYASELAWPSWRPSRIVWHNTALPTLEMWIKSAREDQEKGLVPGSSRIASLERFFRYDNHWTGCPHLFVANDFIWVMNPLTTPGVHSPSFNTTAIGIEMIGDFAKEDPDSGEGLRVKRNTVFATAVLCAATGIEPTDGVRTSSGSFSGSIFLHKQDPRTTHDCPGYKIAGDKARMVQDAASLLSGGDHSHGSEIAHQRPSHVGTTMVDDLNLRSGPGVMNDVLAVLPRGHSVEVLGEARNGSTPWLHVRTGSGMTGWVSGRYVSV